MRPASPAGGPTHASIVSYIVHWLLDWDRRLTQTFCEFTIPWRKTGECGKSKRIRLFPRPLRSTVIRLTSAPGRNCSGHRKTYLVLRYCLFHVPDADLHITQLAARSRLIRQPSTLKEYIVHLLQNSQRRRCSKGA